MCLILYGYPQSEKVTDEEIICYKVLEFDHNVYCTPYRKTLVCFSKGTDLVLKAEGKKTIYDNGVSAGMIHTFSKLKSAKACLKNLSKKSPNYLYYIFECRIPKGTSYYSGGVYEYDDGLASELIVIGRRLWSTRTFLKRIKHVFNF